MIYYSFAPTSMLFLINLKQLYKVFRFPQIWASFKNVTQYYILTFFLSEFTTNLIAAQAFSFFVAGFETTTLSMSKLLYELALNEEVLKRTREELDNILAEKGEFTYDSLGDMVYLQQVIDGKCINNSFSICFRVFVFVSNTTLGKKTLLEHETLEVELIFYILSYSNIHNIQRIYFYYLNSFK
jgi:hypothetical protein